MPRNGRTQRSNLGHGWHLEGLRTPGGAKIRPLKSWKINIFGAHAGFELVTSGMSRCFRRDFGVVFEIFPARSLLVPMQLPSHVEMRNHPALSLESWLTSRGSEDASWGQGSAVKIMKKSTFWNTCRIRTRDLRNDYCRSGFQT